MVIYASSHTLMVSSKGPGIHGEHMLNKVCLIIIITNFFFV
jgi:hypothetical protein